MGEEFKSQLEKIMPAKELLFDPTPGFGKYKGIMPREAIAHPAKFNTNLVEFLIKKFTKEGDIVLDPMAGTGSLGVIAALHGRNAIQVELEFKFFDWMEKARRNVEKLPTLTPKGWIVNICGDARELSKLLGRQADAVITSPPYAEAKGKVHSPEGERKRLEIARQRGVSPDKVSFLDYPGEWGCSKSPQNIENLPLGNIDVVITSPPYEGSLEGTSRHTRGGIPSRDPKLAQTGTYASMEDLDETIKKLRKHGRSDLKAGDLYGGSLAHPYSPSLENIGNLKSSDEEYEALAREVDAIITSPPYCNTFSDWDVTSRSTREGRTPFYSDERFKGKKQNIGNIPYYSRNMQSKRSPKPPKGKETYLEAMLKVYREMWKVLKPGGRAIIVIKPFYRNKKPIDLPYHTYLLMRKVGFELEKLYKLRLKRQSFWRTLYYKKYPEIPRLNHEYVLVMRKP